MLVKNPAGCNQVLEFLQEIRDPFQLVICLNDRSADGTDVSWIWDADFEKLTDLQGKMERVYLSGDRTGDIHVRLKYAGVPEETITEERDYEVLVQMLAKTETPVYIMPTYTALLDLRAVIVRHCGGSEFWE